MSTTTLPTIGQKVYLLPDQNGNWHGIPAEYHDKIGTVSSVEPTADGTKHIIAAEFKSHQKPDDSVRWSSYDWKPVDDEPITFTTRQRMIGKTIKVIYSGSHLVRHGEIHTVTSVWDHPEGRNGPTIDNITVGVTVNDQPRQWVQAYEVIEDGQTLTVSYVPAVGDYVRMTARLNAFGIEHGEWYGTVSKVEGSLILVNVDGLDHATGPEAIEPAERPATPVKPAIITDLLGQVDTMTRELARANERVEELRERASRWERDFYTYSQRIMEEANERDWCEEYDRIMQEIQGNLRIAHIPEREEEYEVEVTVTGSMSYSTTITVTARSQDDADEMVRDDPESYVDADDLLTTGARNNSFDNIDIEVG